RSVATQALQRLCLRSFRRLPNPKSLGRVLRRAGTPIAKLLAQQRRLLRLGRAAKRTREGDAQLKARFMRDGTIAIGGRWVRRSSLIIPGVLHSHPKTLADIERPVVRTAARWPVTHG